MFNVDNLIIGFGVIGIILLVYDQLVVVPRERNDQRNG